MATTLDVVDVYKEEDQMFREALAKGEKRKREEQADKQHEEERKEYLDNLKPTSIKKKGVADGWIAPDGKFFQCGFQGHIRLADDLMEAGIFASKNFNTERKLEQSGWIKLSANGILNFEDVRVTKRQQDAIFDFMESHKMKKISYNGRSKVTAVKLFKILSGDDTFY